MPLRIPPGRSGRIWLTARLATARRGVRLLERKHAALRRELERVAELASRTGTDWEAACHEADRWMMRARITGGGPVVDRDRAQVANAEADLRWATAMGVTYPRVAACRLPPPIPLTGPAALHAAAIGYRRALEAAVRHAAASAAAERLGTELAETGRRLRAIRERWVPRLERALLALELSLDEGEREEIVRTRWSREERP